MSSECLPDSQPGSSWAKSMAAEVRGPKHVWVAFIEKLPELFVDEEQCQGVEVVERPSFLPAPSSSQEMTEGGQNVGNVGGPEWWAYNVEELRAALSFEMPINSSRVFFLHRRNSWSRIGVTPEMFWEIYTSERIMPAFIKLVIGLGRKHSSYDEDYMACYSEMTLTDDVLAEEHQTRNIKQPSRGLCYNVRHFERHGRQLSDPWSCRQSAIHQTYFPDTNTSSWVVIHPPHIFSAAVKEGEQGGSLHPMELHIVYLAAALAHWREYLNYIAETLKEFDLGVAVFKPFAEFGLDFSSKQRIHNLRQKIHHAHEILLNTVDIIGRVGAHEKTLSDSYRFPTREHERFQREISNISGEVQNYVRTAEKLLNVSDGIRALYDDILKFHGQELMHTNGLKLAQIAQEDSADNKMIASLTNRTHRDSRIMRIMTIIALIYLPANLVLAFFSTSLVEFSADTDVVTQDTELLVHSEMWIAALAVFILSFCTFCIYWYWERRANKPRLGQEP